MLPILGIAQANSNGEVPNGGNTSSEKQPLEIKRNAQYNLEEIKVRWKKAALENCAGDPCSAITVPGAPTGVVATVGNSVSVSFVAPTNNGGRAITGYTVTSNPGNITASGTTSPVIVPGLTNGTSYTFTVIATNEVGNSLASSASTTATAFTCGTGTISDIDNNPYETVLIGTQCWTKQNLKVSRYNDGTAIPDLASNSDWQNATTGALTDNIGVAGYVGTYGYLYNWYAAAGIIAPSGSSTKNICPLGWHVPTDTEWTTLTDYLGGTSVAGAKMRSTSTLWSVFNPQTLGTNTSDFSALPGGYRDYNGSFLNISYGALFWSATESNPSFLAEVRDIYYGYNNADRLNKNKSVGASVRCLKD
jgi:uncharacterized protein (TIGR02145 family)